MFSRVGTISIGQLDESQRSLHSALQADRKLGGFGPLYNSIKIWLMLGSISVPSECACAAGGGSSRRGHIRGSRPVALLAFPEVVTIAIHHSFVGSSCMAAGPILGWRVIVSVLVVLVINQDVKTIRIEHPARSAAASRARMTPRPRRTQTCMTVV
jgi:hypothetical protein